MDLLTELWLSNKEILKVAAAWFLFSLACMARDEIRWRREDRETDITD